MVLQSQRIEKLESRQKQLVSLDELGNVMEKFDNRIIIQEGRTQNLREQVESLNRDVLDINHTLHADSASLPTFKPSKENLSLPGDRKGTVPKILTDLKQQQLFVANTICCV